MSLSQGLHVTGRMGDIASQKLFDATNQVLNQEVDNMFGRMHEGHVFEKGEEASNYNKDDYHRYGFSTRADAVQFAENMKNNGYETVVAPTFIKNQVLVEVSKTYSNEDGIPSSFSSAADCVAHYSASTGVVMQGENEYKIAESHDNNRAVAYEMRSDMTSYLVNNMDFLGVAASKAIEVERSVSNFINDHNDLKRSENYFNQSSHDMNNMHSEKALVYSHEDGSHTVIVNGKEVTGAERDYVLTQHNARVAEAQKILTVERDKEETKFNKKEDKREALHNKSEKQRFENHIKSGKSADSFDNNEFQRNKFQTQNVRNKTFQIRQRQAEAFVNNLYSQPQEYTAMTVKTEGQGLRSGGALDELRTDLKNAAAAVGTIGITSFTLSDKDRQIMEYFKQFMNDEQKAALANVLTTGEINTLDEKNALNQFLTKLGGEGSVKGKTLRQAIVRMRGLSELSDSQKDLARSSELLQALKKDFGINVVNGEISREDIVNAQKTIVNRAVEANIQLVTKNGDFDIERFKNLTEGQLKTLGISSVLERDALTKSFGEWGNVDSGFGTLGGIALSKLVKAMDDEDTAKFISGTRTTLRTAKQAGKVTNKFSASVRAKIDAQKAKKVARAKAEGKEVNIPSKEAKPPKTEDLQKGAEKFGKKVDKKLNKLNKADKKMFAKAKVGFNKSAKAATEAGKAAAKAAAGSASSTAAGAGAAGAGAGAVGSAVGTAGGVAAGAGAGAGVGTGILAALPVILIILLCLVVIIIIVCIIASITSSYKDTVAYQLYEALRKDEIKWVQELHNGDTIYEGKDGLAFGDDGVPFAQAIDPIPIADDYIVTGNGTFIALNPFAWGNGGATDADSEYHTTIDTFDGAFDVQITANRNIYGTKYDNNYYVSTENGHTSNIKDILCMLDVMWQMEEKSDAKMAGVLGESSTILKFEEFCNAIAGFFDFVVSNVGAFFTNLFGGNAEGKAWVDCFPAGYSSMSSYVAYLFGASHSQQYDVSVEYYHYDPENKGVEMPNIGKLNLSQPVAAEFNTCVKPKENFTAIAWNKERKDVVAAFKEEAETEAELPEYHPLRFKGNNNTMGFLSKADKNAGEANLITAPVTSLCLWEEMKSDKDTLQEIKLKNCWKLSPTTEEGGLSNVVPWVESTSSYTNAYCGCGTVGQRIDLMALAEKELEEKIKEKEGEYNLNYAEYKLTEDRNSFRHTWYDSGCCTHSYDVKNNGFFGNNVGTHPVVVNGKPTGTCTIYLDMCQLSGVVGCKHSDDTYVRDCMETHRIEYCGGHIAVNAQGNVHSITNEQMASIDAYAYDKQAMVVKDYDVKANGYEELRGKFIRSLCEYTTPYTASTTGGSKSPVEDIQGSVAGTRGLNLYVTDQTSDGWGTDIHPRNDVSIHEMRDIYDVDTTIDKGRNVFPINGKNYKTYEGWSADNMTLAVTRMSMDWTNVYKFDIPLEVNNDVTTIAKSDLLGNLEFGNYIETLGEKDIKAIIESIYANPSYTAYMSEGRKEALENTLAMVGRGHYSKNHADHDFLSETCDALGINSSAPVTYDAICTASNSAGFVKYIYGKDGKTVGTTATDPSWIGYSGINSLRPMDLVRHVQKYETSYWEYWNNLNFKEEDKEFILADTTGKFISIFQDDVYSVFIGKLGTDVTLEDGRVIAAGTMLTVDLADYGGVGSIRLKTEEPTTWCDLETNKHFYWLYHPDEFTQMLRY